MILYYTHNRKPKGFTKRCYDIHRAQADRLGQRFVAVVAEQIGEGDIAFPFDDTLPTYADIYLRIREGLYKAEPKEMVYLCEEDTLYPDVRYEWSTDDEKTVTYNLNICYLGERGFCWHMVGGIALSQLMGTALAVRYNVLLKLDECMARELSCVEPCSGQGRPYSSSAMKLSIPSVDFRTEHVTTWKLPNDVECFERLSHWGTATELWNTIYKGAV